MVALREFDRLGSEFDNNWLLFVSSTLSCSTYGSEFDNNWLLFVSLTLSCSTADLTWVAPEFNNIVHHLRAPYSDLNDLIVPMSDFSDWPHSTYERFLPWCYRPDFRVSWCYRPDFEKEFAAALVVSLTIIGCSLWVWPWVARLLMEIELPPCEFNPELL